MLDVLEDERVRCTSIMTTISVGDYLNLVERVYQDKGGIEGQRAALKTKTAITIRKRMVSDLQQGAVVPPIVVGALVTNEERNELLTLDDAAALPGFFMNLEVDKLSIIDGMQRTTALNEAKAANPDVVNRKIRVEFWVAEFINSLIYRMLVLNTGQVPWELARQLETVYSQFLRQISRALNDEDVAIFSRDDARRRASAAQYQGSSIVELLLVFSSRKTEIELRDKVADDFARLDAIETSAHAEFIDYFIAMLRCLVQLDRAFSRLTRDPERAGSRMDTGKDIFGSFPAMAGFAAAVSVYLFDEAGFHIIWDAAPAKMNAVEQAITAVVDKLQPLDQAQLREFMQLDLLEQRMSGRRGGVGRYERELFKRAFTAMLKNADRLQSMEPCWLAP